MNDVETLTRNETPIECMFGYEQTLIRHNLFDQKKVIFCHLATLQKFKFQKIVDFRAREPRILRKAGPGQAGLFFAKRVQRNIYKSTIKRCYLEFQCSGKIISRLVSSENPDF